ncbi:TRAP transporter small permease [Vibrio algivorus]|uniref:TRAP transporter small permease protein n=1 Tax=Vibrio algivorus TaxID=1667024 RepID=A0ABQ6EK28_9VIBR|nr:TRAP transporter small permease [Vibrio algivorus]GLT13359.1 C4-dicarboxylate TRAP transporter small permease protein DctQ [Vibrio algivorus]
MNAVHHLWSKLEEGLVAFLLAAMTLVTFTYVVLNNLYTPFYDLSDWFYALEWSATSNAFLSIGDFFIGLAQEMTWSTALTKALFGWLIFIGMSYGVRIGGHIGVDVVVNLLSTRKQKVIGIIACLACLTYAAMMTYASYDWVSTLFHADIYAEDLEKIGIKVWYIGAVVPVGFALLWIRFFEIFIRILRGLQLGLGIADETKDAMKHAMAMMPEESQSSDQTKPAQQDKGKP